MVATCRHMTFSLEFVFPLFPRWIGDDKQKFVLLPGWSVHMCKFPPENKRKLDYILLPRKERPNFFELKD